MDDDTQQLRLELVGISGPALEPGADEIAELAAALAAALADDPDGSSFGLACRQAAVAASLRLMAGDRSMIGRSSQKVLGSAPGDRPSTEDEWSPIAVVGWMAGLVRDGHVDLLPVLGSLASYGGPFQEPAAAQLRALDRPWGGGPAPAVASAHLVTSAPGDEEELALEVTFPHDPPHTGGADAGRVGLVVLLDTFAGRRPVDVMLLEDIDAYLEETRTGRGLVRVEEVSAPDAMARLGHAIWIFDHTLDAVADLPDDSDLMLVRPLLERLVASHPDDATFEPAEVDDGEREAAIGDFTRWLDGVPHGFDADDLDFVPLLIDFAADNADDPRRWSARVVVEFLEMGCQRVSAPPHELAVLPDLVRHIVRWAHDAKGWPADLTAATLEVIDEVQPLFEAELAGVGSAPAAGDHCGPAGESEELTAVLAGLLGQLVSSDAESGLIVPPAGGSHPEPFDDRRLPVALRERVGAIAAEATERAVELFDAEFATLVRRLIADAARRKNTPLGRGKPPIWASAAVYAVAQLNEIPGGWSPLARPATDITARLAGAPTTIATKARTLRDLLGADRFPPEPRYQHSTSTGPTSDLLSSLAGLLGGPGEVGSPARPSGNQPIPPSWAAQPGSVDPTTLGGDCFVLRASLADIRPEIWRRVRVPVDATFAQLHHLFQLVFGWYGYHLHAFEIGDSLVGPTGGELGFHDPDGVDEEKLRLCDAVGPGSEFVYVYDFGDNWEHLVVVEGAENVDTRTDIVTGQPMGSFALLAGAMAGPPEDCGGWPGYTEILRSLKNKNRSRSGDLAELVPPGFDPTYFDVYTLNQAVHRAGWDR
ncbi:MAG: DUF6398 domain-containing protein [Acidimicrobiales bacterium]